MSSNLYLESHPVTDTVDLTAIDASKQLVTEIREQATLKDALRTPIRSGCNALVVTGAGRRPAREVGIVTREQVTRYLQH